tara:strand:- start:26032 stop:26679 length:648 start_codon:yes stop_codon:yes gene_type:complete
MADEENEELTEMTPMDRVRRVAGNVMQYIRDEANKPYTGYGGTIGLRPEEARMAADLVDNTAEAREFIESPGLGTGAMAALGLFGFPAKELRGLSKLAGKKLDDMTDDDFLEAMTKYRPETEVMSMRLEKAKNKLEQSISDRMAFRQQREFDFEEALEYGEFVDESPAVQRALQKAARMDSSSLADLRKTNPELADAYDDAILYKDASSLSRLLD